MDFFTPSATTLLDKIKNICTGYTAMIIWVFFISLLLNFLWTPLQFFYIPEPIQYTIFFTCIFAPLWEELAFRVIPIKLALNLNPESLPAVVALSSIIFGFGHGGVENILIQGVMGVILSWVYIKNNYSYWSSVSLHALWNITVTILTL